MFIHSSDSNPPRVVLFDFEGTLVGFQWNLRAAVHDAKAELRRLRLDASLWDDNYATLRNTAVQYAAQQGWNKHEVMDCIDAVYDRYDQDAASRWSALPGVKPTLLRLKSQNIKLGLVSNIGREAISHALPRLELDGLFDVIVTRNDVEMLKPNGEGIRLALKKLKAHNSNALFVGDSVTDVLGAKEAGIPVAIVQGGESAPPSLIAANPSYLWKSMNELAALFTPTDSPSNWRP